MFCENYTCGSDRNYTGFCDKEVDAPIERQSAEPNAEKRRQLVWEIERRLARDASRPIIFYTRVATCWRPRVKGLNLVVNSVFNSWRFEDVWLDRQTAASCLGNLVELRTSALSSRDVLVGLKANLAV